MFVLDAYVFLACNICEMYSIRMIETTINRIDDIRYSTEVNIDLRIWPIEQVDSEILHDALIELYMGKPMKRKDIMIPRTMP